MIRLLALGLVLLVAACASEPGVSPSAEPGSEPAPDALPNPVTVRGLYLGPAHDGAAAVVSHEAVPGVMNAMRMPIRVADPAELSGLSEGDKISFTLIDTGDGYEISAISTLPPETELTLADFGADAVPPEASLGPEALPDSL